MNVSEVTLIETGSGIFVRLCRVGKYLDSGLSPDPATYQVPDTVVGV